MNFVAQTLFSAGAGIYAVVLSCIAVGFCFQLLIILQQMSTPQRRLRSTLIPLLRVAR